MRLAPVLLAALVVASTGCSRVHRYMSQRAHQAAREHPGKLYIPQAVRDTGVVLAGPDGRGADGAPLRYVDREQLLAMLDRQQYARLTQIFEDLQNKFEADASAEDWPIQAVETFTSQEATRDAALDAWVATSPTSFAPYLARGAHHRAAGFAARGAAVAKETSAAAMAEMNDRFQRARADLDKAASMRPKAQAIYSSLVAIGGATSDRDMVERANAAATATCPTCLRVRETYLHMQTPRWGGSYAVMGAYAQATAKAGPRTKYLAGYVALDRAELLEGDKKLSLALQAVDQACAIGEYPDFLLERAIIEHANGDLDAALIDARRADQLEPGSPGVLIELADEEADDEAWEPAASHLLHVLRMSPTNRQAGWNAAFIFDGLIEDATDALVQKDLPRARRESVLATDLGPDDPRARTLHENVVRAGGESVEDLRSTVQRDPGNFEAVQELDSLLGKQGHEATLQMIPIWTAYIALHPDDGRAYLERGGTYFNNHQIPEATADARKACTLGASEGCLRAKQIAGGAH